MKKKIYIILAIIVFTGLFFVLSLKISTPAEESIPSSDIENGREFSEKNDEIDTYIDISGYKTNQYRIDELGLTFNYPDILTLEEIRVNSGQTGKKLIGYLELSNKYRISFGAVTKDFSKPRGGSITDTFGYKKIEDEYYLSFVWNDYKLNQNEFLLIDDDSIIVINKEIGFVLSNDAVVAFVNILDKNFPGVVFSLSSLGNERLNKDEIVQIFQQIIPLISFE